MARAPITKAPDALDHLRADYEAKLNAVSDAHIAECRDHAATVGFLRDEIATLREEVATLNRRLKRTQEKLDAERKAHDETKGELLDALLQVERLRGYLNAVQDLRPPRMVEEAHERLGAERGETYARERRLGPPPAKRFYERGN